MGSLQFTIHIIAPYRSKGIEKAEELTVGWSAQASSNNKCQKAADQSNGKVVCIAPWLHNFMKNYGANNDFRVHLVLLLYFRYM